MNRKNSVLFVSCVRVGIVLRLMISKWRVDFVHFLCHFKLNRNLFIFSYLLMLMLMLLLFLFSTSSFRFDQDLGNEKLNHSETSIAILIGWFHPSFQHARWFEHFILVAIHITITNYSIKQRKGQLEIDLNRILIKEWSTF